MKVTLLSVLKNGEREVWRLRNLIEDRMCCPQCGYSLEEAKEKYVDNRHVTFLKSYGPMEFKEETKNDLEYKCRKCECEWLVEVLEPK